MIGALLAAGIPPWFVVGVNWMSRDRRQRVVETAERTVAERLRRPDLREALRDLPRGPGHKIREPPGPPATWPRLPTTRAA